MSALPADLFDDVVERSPLALPPRYRLEDQYLVGRVLGHPGGFGITYLGWEGVLKRRVAIKEYLPRDLVSRSRDGVSIVPHSSREGQHFSFGLDRFLDEARTLAALSHPNVVRVHRFFEANGTAYLVMEYHRGASLAEYLEKAGGRLPWQHAIDLTLSILAGLEATHQNGILHCDIKPQNIYLTEQQQVILLDYGAARLAITERTQTTNRVMTPGYAAWEMYLEQGEIGPWTDVYSSAATLLQLLTGRRPPPAIDRLVRDPLDLAASGLPQPLAPVLTLALAIAPQERIPTARAFAAELRRVLAANDDGTGEVLAEFGAAEVHAVETFEEATRSWQLVAASTTSQEASKEGSEAAPDHGPLAKSSKASTTEPGPSTARKVGKRGRWAFQLLALAGVLTLAAIFPLWEGRTTEREKQAVVALPLHSVPPPKAPEVEVVPERLGSVVVDATPWGNVVDIRGDPPRELDLALPCATPCVLELPAGRFTLDLRRTGSSAIQSLEVEVIADEVVRQFVSFADVDATRYFLETGW